MKAILCFLLLLVTTISTSAAQQTIQLKKLWSRQQVRLIFGGYNIFLRIKDIDRSLAFLPDVDKEMYGASCGLDTNKSYVVELLPGRRMEYRNAVEPLLQNGVGAFLLISGHARIEAPGGRALKKIQANVGEPRDMNGSYVVPVDIYDPDTGQMLFSGVMNTELYHKDLGID